MPPTHDQKNFQLETGLRSTIIKIQLPTQQACLCPVVNSRVTLTHAKHSEEQAGTFVYRFCSNLDNCYNRSDFTDQIPECLLHRTHITNK